MFVCADTHLLKRKRVTAHTSIRNILDFIAKKGFIHELYKKISTFNSFFGHVIWSFSFLCATNTNTKT